jgi:HPr kinase/phosphorylase
MHELIAFLEDAFSPTTTIHGTLVDVYGIGLLYTGSSGIGKSECALDLVERGHRLVADDIVTVRATPQGILMGSGSELLRHHMEIRGIGIIDVQSIFGIRGVRLMKRIEVEVRLEAWDEIEDYERLGLDEKSTTILGIEIPQVTVPIIPGKNLTVISEVVALNHLMKVTGYNPAEEFNKRLVDLMAKKDGATLRERLKGDRE